MLMSRAFFDFKYFLCLNKHRQSRAIRPFKSLGGGEVVKQISPKELPERIGEPVLLLLDEGRTLRGLLAAVSDPPWQVKVGPHWYWLGSVTEAFVNVTSKGGTT